MRAAVVSLALVASSCAFGAGVGPEAVPPTTSLATTSTTVATTTTAPVDPATRAAAITAARSFLDALAAGDWDSAAAMVTQPPEGLTETMASWSRGLTLTSVGYSIAGDTVTDAGAEITASATVIPRGFDPWRYQVVVPLIPTDDGWRVTWSPSILHPDLDEGDTLEVRTVWHPRGSILARNGTPLAMTAPAWTIGVVPGLVDDLDALTALLEDTAGVSPEVVRTELAKPGVQPDWFVAVGTIVASESLAVATLESTPGILLRETTARVRPQGELAGQLVGRVGPITAERLDSMGAPYGPFDEVGVTGLEQAFERDLAGTPDVTIVHVNRYGRDLETLLSAVGEPPRDVTTTLDVSIQRAAEQALTDVTKPAAIVIIDTDTSEVRAVVSRPADGFERALLGAYPPGSTFKIVTAAALLTDGMTPDDRVDCPAEVTLGGLTIPNAGYRDLGIISLTTAFAQSCNTTFTSLAVERLTAAEMAEMADTFGFGVAPSVGAPTATPSYPVPGDTAELAASAMGQGRVLVTPLHQATIAAAVASGGWLPATLISGKTPDRERTSLDPDVRRELAGMMQAVVEEGGAGKAKVPGEVVRGKTGSAEYNDQGDTHAWFIGYWDHIAFAIVVEGGGSGGQTSAPIAAEIIRDLSGKTG